MANTTDVFIHIPKTAGSTLHDVLSRQYREQDTFTINGLEIKESVDEFSNYPQSKKDSFSLIKGHYSLLLGRQVTNEKRYFTFLRNPLDRLQSSYYYIRSSSHNRFNEEIKKIKTLDDFALWSLDNERDNMQARSLLNNVKRLSQEYQDVKNHGLISNSAECKKILDTEVKNVLLTERFDESLLLLKHELAWQKKPYYLNKNVTRNKPTYTRDVSSIVSKVIGVDLDLYSHAEAMFENRCKRYPTDLAFEVLNFRKKLIKKQQFLRLENRSNYYKNKVINLFKK